MKHLISTLVIISSLTAANPIFAKDLADIKVGSVMCYDGFGPFDVIGIVLSKNYSNDSVTLRKASGGSKSYPSQKIKSPMFCKAKNAIGKELLKRGVDALGNSSEN